MQRKRFIQTCLATGAFMMSPITMMARSIKKFRDGNGFLVSAGKDRFDKPITLLQGDTFFTKISTKDTNGDLYVYESTRLKEGGPPHHYHFNQDEWWYVLEGEFLIKVGETIHRAKAGDSVFGPRMVPHSFAKVGEAPGKLLMIFQPAGKMEEYFKKVSEGATKDLTEEERVRMNEEYEVKQVGLPITYLKR